MVQTLPPADFGGPALAGRPAPQQPVADATPAPPPAPVAPPTRYPRRPLTMPAPAAAGVPSNWLPPAPARRWNWIVIHHSATATGGSAAFDRMHRAKGWDEMGYHFVIGNGSDTRDGLVEVGSRWHKQKHGAHAKTPDNRYNDFGIGVCLVGNFDFARPSAEQLRSLSALVAHLMRTYHVPPERVIGHGSVKSTECPGRYLSVAEIRRRSTQILADAGELPPGSASAHAAADPIPAGTELLTDRSGQ